MLEKIGAWSLAAIFTAGAVACASPRSGAGFVLDEIVGRTKQGYTDCIDDIYFPARAAHWMDDPGRLALVSVLARMRCLKL